MTWANRFLDPAGRRANAREARSREARRLRSIRGMELIELELRRLMATFVVNGTDDSGAGTLRQAILDANAAPGPDAITFNIPGAGPFVIQPQYIGGGVSLPAVTDQVAIDATTQPGYAGAPIVRIDGAFADDGSFGSFGLNIQASGSLVRGLSITGFRNVGGNGFGIGVFGSTSSVQIEGNYVGVTPAGTAAGNDQGGIWIGSGANGNVIGGTGAGQGNVISGNGGSGMLIHSNNNTVLGNTIGLDPAGTAALGNGNAGVRIQGDTGSGDGNTIGGNAAGARNVIAGNLYGVIITASADSNVVAGNFIGTNAAGTAAVGSPSQGVIISGGSTGNRIGTDGDGVADSAERNLISGHTQYGVLISGANANRVAGNAIGTDASGLAAIPNQDAVAIFSGTGNIIGTDGSNDAFNANERNLISGNNDRGIILDGANVAAGNWIGLDANGATLGNGYGIQVTNTGGRVGTNADGVADAEERNVIAGSTFDGIAVRNPGTTGAIIAGNYIGLDPTGTLARPNATGIGLILGTTANTVGGTSASARNVIAGNTNAGVELRDPGTASNVLLGNYIGLGPGGAALGNAGDGVRIAGSPSNTIGGTVAAARNIIGGNAGAGIQIDGAGGNVVAGNYIGTDPTGTAARANAGRGIAIGSGATGNTIGGSATLLGQNVAGNLISGNGGRGMQVFAADTTIQGNRIGTTADGSAALGNALVGIELDTAGTVTVGGPNDANVRGNLISANSYGIRVLGGVALVQGNTIGLDLAGTADLGNTTDGIDLNTTGNTIGGATAGLRNVVSGNGSAGITLRSGQNLILGNYIGTDAAGGAALGNGDAGIYILSAPDNTLGGTTPGAGNVISGNSTGIWIEDLDGVTATGNLIAGNLVGLDATGAVALGNATDGLDIRSERNTIGGTTAAARNVIAASGDRGIALQPAAARTVVLGNFIGTDISGLLPRGNSDQGMLVASPRNTIGGPTAAARNLISANGAAGMLVQGAGATENLVAGNLIGTVADGTAALSNSGDGIFVSGGSANTIGGTAAGAGNVLSGNTAAGIRLFGPGATANLVLGNLIGTNLAGDASIGTQLRGILIDTNASANTVGGASAAARNVLSGNVWEGVALHSGAAANLVAGNYVGVNAPGTAPLANGTGGFWLADATGNTIGGLAATPGAAPGNVISGNSGSGILMTGNGTGNLVAGNLVGLAPDGMTILSNAGSGLDIQSAGNTIGGAAAGARNIISGNNSDGIFITGPSTSGNLVLGNWIGVDANGNALDPATIGWLKAENNAADSAGGLSASINAGVSYVAGQVGQAFGFDGTSGTVTVASNAALETSRFAFEAWIYSPATQPNKTIVAKGADGAGNFAYALRTNATGQLIFGASDGTTLRQTNGVAFSNNAWHHVAATWDGTAVSLYLDGAEVRASFGAITVNFAQADRNLSLGSYGGTGGFWQGRIDEFTLYNTFLGTGEIASIYAAGGFGKRGNLSGNRSDGIEINLAPNNTIGGAAGNFIGGNFASGILLGAGGTVTSLNTVIIANAIGANPANNRAAPNRISGISVVDGAADVTIGAAGAAGNLISANTGPGIFIGTSGTSTRSRRVLIQNNLVGTDVAGAALLGNAGYGVQIDGTANTVGGTAAGLGNVLSGNLYGGVISSTTSATGNLIAGNMIGLNAAGTAPIRNRYEGITLLGNNNTVGGTAAAARNVVGGNGGGSGGLFVVSSNNLVINNLVGTNAAGTAFVRNDFYGIKIGNGAAAATGNTIGGATAAERNLVSGNARSGIYISGAGATGNRILGNFIGTDAAGTTAIANLNDGIRIDAGSSGNTVGGLAGTTGTGLGNVISGNTQSGVNISGAGGNVVAGNLVGLAAGGVAGLGNGLYGVDVNTAPNNTIGGTAAGARNVVSGNASYGIHVRNAATTGVLVAGNYVGTDITGTLDRGNALHGIRLFQAVNNTVSGNVASGNSGDGISISGGGSGNLIIANFAGTDYLGQSAIANDSGISILNGTNNTIGGATAAARNIISGNSAGVWIENAATTGNVIAGNDIGLGADGTSVVANSAFGGLLLLDGAHHNTIGGPTAAPGTGPGNVISGNAAAGVSISGSAVTANVLLGNLIGTDASGTAARPNIGNGVIVTAGSNANTIGGATATARNVISGNAAAGVNLVGAGVTLNVVAGNYVGTNRAGTAALANGNSGILVRAGAQNNTIGGLASTPGAAPGNLASGNALAGIAFENTGTTGNIALGNLVGLSADGSAAVPNNAAGIGVVSGASANTIGGTSTAARNVVSGNAAYGIFLGPFGASTAGASNNRILGNYIGTDPAGTAARPNAGPGVFVQGGSGAGSTGNTIGGATAAAANLISGNTGPGVHLSGSFAPGNLVAGNLIGTDASGSGALGNGADGIQVFQSSNNTIGGLTPTPGTGPGNVVSNNAQRGIWLVDSSSNLVQGNIVGLDAAGINARGNGFQGIEVEGNSNTVGGTAAGSRNVVSASGGGFGGIFLFGNGSSNLVAGNFVGTDVTGTVARGNVLGGIQVIASQNNTIGGTAAAARNVIAGNGQDGILFSDADNLFGTTGPASGNLVLNNWIGQGPGGPAPLGNARHGVRFASGSNNTVGGTAAGSGNVIANNTAGGVAVLGGSGDAIRGNIISANGGLGIDLGTAGVTPNDLNDPDGGPNGLQNFPILAAATTPSGTTRVSGTLNATPNALVHLDFYLNSVGDPSGHGQAESYLGSMDVTTSASGDAQFVFVYGVALPPHTFIAATATDAAGNTSEFAFNLDVNNAPTPPAGGALSVGEGVPLLFDTSAAGDPDLDPLSFSWDFGDGTAGTGANPSHTYRNDGIYGVTLAVSDGHGGLAAAVYTVTVSNVAPTLPPASLSLTPEPLAEDGTVTLAGTILDPGPDDAETVVITWGDDSDPTTIPLAAGVRAFSTTHRYLDNPASPAIAFPIHIALADSNGATGSADTGLVVQNVPPALAPLVLDAPTIDEDDVLTLSGTIIDPGTLDSHNVAISWGDGSADTTLAVPAGTLEFSATHRYLNNAVGTASSVASIQVTVTDKDGGSGTAAGAVTVRNVAPTVAIRDAGDSTDATVSLLAVVGEPGTLDNPTIEWSVTRDGLPYASGTGPSLRFSRDPYGTYRATARVVDDDAEQATATALIVGGTPADDTIRISPAGAGQVGVEVNGTNLGTFDAGSVVIAFGGEGNNQMTADPALTVGVQFVSGSGDDVLVGGQGSDTLVGGPGANVLLSGPGDDVLVSTGHDDTLQGGGGNDVFRIVPGPDPILEDNSGVNTIDLTGATLGVTLDLNLADGTPQTVDSRGSIVVLNGTFQNLVGSPHADRLMLGPDGGMLVGGGGEDTLFGGAGNDTIVGGRGNSTIVGGRGNSTIFGGTGNDSIVGGAGNSTIVGGKGNSTIFGGSGNDSIVGGSGNNTIQGGRGPTTIFGGRGNDSIVGGSGGNTIVGGKGNSTIFGGSGNDSIVGGSGNNSIVGGSGGRSTIFGGAGNDTIVGGGGNTTIQGGRGNSTIFGGAGNDSVVGGSGNSTIVVGGHTVFGGAGNDTIVGGGGNNTIVGGRGNSTIFGGSGNDSIVGGEGETVIRAGRGTIFGGAGNDTVVGGNGNSTIVGGRGNSTIFGGSGNDSIVGGSGNNTIVGGPGGNHTIFGGSGNDSIVGGGGNTTIVGGPGGNHTIFGGAGNDSIVGGGGNTTIVGGRGNTTIFGGSGNDSIVGGSGNSTLVGGTGGRHTIFGGSGNDSIVGGSGNNTIRGGGGRDTVFAGGAADIRLVESGDGDLRLTAGGLTMPGYGEITFNDPIQGATLVGGAGSDRLDASGFGGPVSLAGLAGDDTLIGGARDDSLAGGGGCDSLVGGAGDDLYVFGGSDSGCAVVDDSASGDNGLDFTSFGAPVNLDLSAGGTQDVAPARLSLRLIDPRAISVVLGSSFADAIVGNDRGDTVIGGGGLDRLRATAGDNYLQAGRTQVVFLDFGTAATGGGGGPETPFGAGSPTALQAGVGGPGNGHTYTQDERDAIQARIGAAFAAIHVQFTQQRPASGPYATLRFNATTSDYIAGAADEVDWRNINPDGSADIDVDRFLGGPSQPEAISANYISLTATVGAHELGHLLGLRHGDNFGPIGSGIYAAVDPDSFYPTYAGPRGAVETPWHIMSSPNSVNTTLFDAVGDTFFGEREDIKLAFADTGGVALEQASGHQSASEAQPLTLTALAVPNTAIRGLHAGSIFDVRAAGVVGSIGRDATGRSEDDYYSFTALAGQVISLEVYSQVLARIANPIDSILNIYDSSGQLVASNDNGLQGVDAQIYDWVAPADGIYVVQVDTFAPSPDLDGDTGGYELLIYSFAPRADLSDAAPDGRGDTLVAGSGRDTMVGSSGGDLFVATSRTVIVGGSATYVLDRAPSEVQIRAGGVAVTDLQVDEGGAVALSGTFTDPDPGETYSYRWSVASPNGQAIADGTGPAFSFTPQDDGTYLVTFTVDDGRGGLGTATIGVTSRGVAPTAALVAPTSLPEGALFSLELAGAADASPIDEAAGFAYSYDLGSGYGPFGPGARAPGVAPDDGTLAVGVRVRDKDGATREYRTTIEVTAVPPRVLIQGAAIAFARTPYTLNLSALQVGADAITSWTIDWGDGQPAELVSGNPTAAAHTYSAAGPALITARATDEDGTYPSGNSVALTVVLANPEITIAGAATAGEGSAYTIALPTGPSLGGGTLARWAIDWGDGPAEIVGGNPDAASHTYDDGPSSRSILATALDAGGAVLGYSNTLNVSVANSAPTAVLGHSGDVDEGSPVTVSFTGARDSSAADDAAGLRFSFALDPAALAATYAGALDGPSRSFRFEDDGAYTIFGRVFDRDGDFTQYQATITARGIDPIAALTNDGPIDEGGSATLRFGPVTDPSPADATAGFRYSLATSAAGLATSYAAAQDGAGQSFTFPDDGTFTVFGRVFDKDGGFTDRETTVVVRNVAPTLAIGGVPPGSAGVERSPISLVGTASDPGAGDLAGPSSLTWSILRNGAAYTEDAAGPLALTGPSLSFTPDDNGFYLITLTARDKDGAAASVTAGISVFDVAPTASIVQAPATGDEGAEIHLAAAAADISEADTRAGFSFAWSIDKEHVAPGGATTRIPGYKAGSGATLDFVPDDDGTYTVTLFAIDKDGGVSLPATTTIAVRNAAPATSFEAAITPPAGAPAGALLEGSTIDLTASALDPSAVDDAFGFLGTWSVARNGVTLGQARGGNLRLLAADQGLYLVTFAVQDKDGAIGTTSRTFEVANAAPAVTTPADQAASEGAAASFVLGSFGDFGLYDAAWTVSIDWGDGTPATAIQSGSQGPLGSQSHTYADSGNFRATVTVTDRDGGVGTATFLVAVENRAPTASIINAPSTAVEGTPVVLGSRTTDPSLTDALAGYTLLWAVTRNGQPFALGTNLPDQGQSFTFLPDDDGRYVVTLTATDKDGTTSLPATWSIDALNAPPRLTAPATPSSTEGSTAPIALGSFTDAGTLDGPWSVHVAWGDGSTSDFTAGAPGALARPHAYLDNGNYTVIVTVEDKDQGSDTRTFNVPVANAAPVVTAAGDQAADQGLAKAFNLGSFSDAGLADGPWTVAVDWGDQTAYTAFTTAQQGTLGTRTHAYAADGSFQVTVRVTDKDNEARFATFQVTTSSAILVLDRTAGGALDLSGNARLSTAGRIVVDSSSSSAITASGDATVNAGSIGVVGGVRLRGNAALRPSAQTGIAAVADPLSGLPLPTGLVSRGSVNLSGNSSATIQPGIYTSIRASGNARLTLAPGTYAIAGGGLSISGNAALAGNGVTIFNVGSNYPTNSGGSFGGVAIGGNGAISLTPQTSGSYAGLLIVQPGNNTRALAINGNGTLGISGAIYAPAALLTLSGNAALHASLVVGTLKLSGNAVATMSADGATAATDGTWIAGQLLGSDLLVFIDNGPGLFSPDELARIRAAIASIDATLSPYSVTLGETADPAEANLTLLAAPSSPVGGRAEGVLGATTQAGQITIVEGWDWYSGADAAAIGLGEFDLQTVVTHELGHALGLGHGIDASSVMYAMLAPGRVKRTLSAADLAIPEAEDEEGPAVGLRAAFTPPPGGATLRIFLQPEGPADHWLIGLPASGPDARPPVPPAGRSLHAIRPVPGPGHPSFDREHPTGRRNLGPARRRPIMPPAVEAIQRPAAIHPAGPLALAARRPRSRAARAAGRRP